MSIQMPAWQLCLTVAMHVYWLPLLLHWHKKPVCPAPALLCHSSFTAAGLCGVGPLRNCCGGAQTVWRPWTSAPAYMKCFTRTITSLCGPHPYGHCIDWPELNAVHEKTSAPQLPLPAGLLY